MSPFRRQDSAGSCQDWFMNSVTQRTLADLRSTDVGIAVTTKDDEPFLFWDVDDETMETLRRHRMLAITNEVGFSLLSAKEKANGHVPDPEPLRRWNETDSNCPSVQDALNTRFGDPNTVKDLPIEEIQRRWDNGELNLMPVSLVFERDDKNHSSNVNRIEYDKDSKTLVVEFAGPSIYHYHDVPRSVVRKLKAAPSKGRFLYDNIRDHYKYEKVA